MASSRSTGTGNRQPHGQGPLRPGSVRVLVVEDSVSQRMLLRGYLEQAGYRVDDAISAAEATRKLRKEAIDLVLVKWELPELSGPELIERWREDEQIDAPPAVLVTSYDDPSHLADAWRHGAVAYVSKPLDADQLESQLAALGDVIASRERIARPGVAEMEAPLTPPLATESFEHEASDTGPDSDPPRPSLLEPWDSPMGFTPELEPRSLTGRPTEAARIGEPAMAASAAEDGHPAPTTPQSRIGGAFNRLATAERLEAEFSRATRYDRRLCVALLQIADFASLMSEHGAEGAERVEAQLAAELRRGLRASDLCSPEGGGRFFVLLTESGLLEALGTVHRLRSAIERRSWGSAEAPCALSLRVGLAPRRAHAGDATELIERAERSLASGSMTEATAHPPEPIRWQRSVSAPRPRHIPG